MPLILVIVADPHEAAQLATLIQGRLSVDLVQASEVGEGLLALEDRIPDLILTSPLMSPFDDGVLDEYLRDLGPAGAHVQTLRIPVLSQTPKKTKRLGFSLRRSKPEAPTIDGCEPKVFADEIEQYLARAAEEKRHVESNDQPVVVERQATFAEPEIAEEQWAPAYSEDEPAANVSWSAAEPEAEAGEWRTDLRDRPPVEEATPVYQPAAYEETSVDYESPVQQEEVTPQYEPIATQYETLATELEPDSVDAVATWQEEVVSEPAPVEETLAAEPFPTPAIAEPIAEPTIEPEPIAEERVEPEASVDTHVVVATAKPAAPASDDNTASPSFKAALAAIRAAWGKPPRKAQTQSREPETLVPAPPEPRAAATKADQLEVDLTGDVEAPIHPVAETLDLYELSVESDLNELKSKLVAPVAQTRGPMAPKPAPAARVDEEDKKMESAPAPAADAHADGKKKGKRAAKGAKAARPARQAQVQPQAAQNEWGIFDPSQCGFAALVDKLDEVADKKTERPQTGAKARVISLS
jgi:hypothetical protein